MGKTPILYLAVAWLTCTAAYALDGQGDASFDPEAYGSPPTPQKKPDLRDVTINGCSGHCTDTEGPSGSDGLNQNSSTTISSSETINWGPTAGHTRPQPRPSGGGSTSSTSDSAGAGFTSWPVGDAKEDGPIEPPIGSEETARLARELLSDSKDPPFIKMMKSVKTDLATQYAVISAKFIKEVVVTFEEKSTDDQAAIDSASDAVANDDFETVQRFVDALDERDRNRANR